MDKLKLSAYEIIEVRKIADIESMGYILRHKKSGARVFVISNEDGVFDRISDTPGR